LIDGPKGRTLGAVVGSIDSTMGSQAPRNTGTAFVGSMTEERGGMMGSGAEGASAAAAEPAEPAEPAKPERSAA